MQREDIVDLNAFATVAEERSFTKASIRLGTSQSALSHAVRRLETRLGVRLLNRTTRSVSPTEAGQQLLDTLQSSFQSIAERLGTIGHLREEPAGSIRISTSEHALQVVLWPKLSKFMKTYPAVQVEIEVDPAGPNIVDGRFDAGIRLGDDIDKDMVAVRISPDLLKSFVASPKYLAGRTMPRSPHDLVDHACLTYRRPLTGRILPWDFIKRGKKIQLRMSGRLVFNNIPALVTAALDGHGIVAVAEDYVTEYVAKGDLIRILPEWSPTLSGFHLYYPSRRQMSVAFSLLVDTLRHHGS
ncbi:LysR family transcriptional regulator [Comamonadaceae bacterium PP-2]